MRWTPFKTIFPSCDISPNLSVEYSHKTSGCVCWILVISAMAQYHIKANLLPGKHFGVCYFIDVFVALLRGWKSNRDLFFFFGKDIFCLVTSVKQKKFWVPRRNRTSDLRIPRSDAIPQRLYSKQGLLRSSYMTRVLHNASFVMGLPYHGISVVQC